MGAKKRRRREIQSQATGYVSGGRPEVCDRSAVAEAVGNEDLPSEQSTATGSAPPTVSKNVSMNSTSASIFVALLLLVDAWATSDTIRLRLLLATLASALAAGRQAS